MDNKIIKNYILLKVVKRLGLSYRQKRDLYPLVTISGDLIIYKDGIIYLETGPVEMEIKGWSVVMSFDVLLLGKDKAVLRMPFL